MATLNPPVQGTAWETDVELEDWANPGLFKANPTLAAGDVKITKENGAEANLTTLPTVSPAGGTHVRTQFSGTETTTTKATVKFHDQTNPPEWADYALTIFPVEA